ncbi:MAG: protein kinase, partial [Myxococcota bacterium]
MATRRRRPLRVKGLELLLPLKRGGMGEVWLARRTGAHGFSRLVAVKLIRRELSDHEEARAMFLDEARVLASVSHPTITQAFDFGEQGRNLYLVLEYVPGVSLSRLQRRLGRPL